MSKKHGSRFYNTKKVNFNDTGRGREVIDKMNHFCLSFLNETNMYPPAVIVTVEEMREFLVYVRNWMREKVHNDVVGFPGAGDRGYTFGFKVKGHPFTQIPIEIIEPTIIY